MQIPTGDWIVIMRHARDTRSSGEIIKYLVSERIAKAVAALNQHNSDNWNYWAMPIHEYHKPYSEKQNESII